MSSGIGPDPRPRVVLDTNIFISGIILRRGYPHAVLGAWQVGRFRLVVPQGQLAELTDVLARPKIIRYFAESDERAAFLRQLHEQAEWLAPTARASLAVRDAKDAYLLSAALDGRFEYLVTGDNDLLVLAGDQRLGALRIVTARAFLAVLDADPWATP